MNLITKPKLKQPQSADCTPSVIQTAPCEFLTITQFEGDENDCVPADASFPAGGVGFLHAMFRAAAAIAPGREKASRGFWIAAQLKPATDETLAGTSPAASKLRGAKRECAFRNGYRSNLHVLWVTAVVVDYDELPAEQPDWRPESWPGKVLWHTSHSFHPEKAPGKNRAVLPLRTPITLADYYARLPALRRMLPPGSKVRAPVQPAFWPTCPAGQTVRVGVVMAPLLDWSALDETTADARDAGPVAALHGRALDIRMFTALIPPAGHDWGRHPFVRAIGAYGGKNGFSDEAIKAAIYTVPTDKIADRIEQALGAAKRARAGQPVKAWQELKCTFDADTLDAFECANEDPFVTRLRERSAVRAANDAADATAGRAAAVDNVITAIAAPEVGVYQRAGMLCTVTHEAVEERGMVRPAGAPTIRSLPPARLQEIIGEVCGPKLAKLATTVAARGEWGHIRPLDALAMYPVMRRDGTLLLESGYDAVTRTLARISLDVSVDENPTRADARMAANRLLDVLCDFPASDAAKAVWLVMLLTVVARPAIDGPTPLGLLEATERGSGKTLLADLIALITTGATVPRRVAPKTKEEWDKTMLATLAAGDPLVLIDNVTTMLVSDALDAVLTGTTYSGRWLGVSENRTVAVRTVFLASSNNAQLSSDLVRRSIVCRLEPSVERPEARTDFKHADLAGYVRQHRAELLGAALTILRAYVVAGRPPVEARRMGSYEAWSRVVRDAVVWAGCVDPAITQDDLREGADVERDEVRALFSSWHRIFGERSRTVKQLLERQDVDWRDALRANMPHEAEPTPHMLSMRLRRMKGRIVDGLRMQPGLPDKHTKTATWRVFKV